MKTQSIIPPNIDYGKIYAEPFSDKKPYVVGELCIQFNKLWKFKSPKDAGAWDESKVEETTIANELIKIKVIKGSATCSSQISAGSYQAEYEVTEEDLGFPLSNVLNMCVEITGTARSNAIYAPKKISQNKFYLYSSAASDIVNFEVSVFYSGV